MMTWNPTRRRGALDVTVLAVLAITLVLGVASAAYGGWTVRLEPMTMEAHGHDQHVLTIHEIDFDSTPQVDDKTAVSLDTESGMAYRGELRYTRGQWGLGVDFFGFTTSQIANPPTFPTGPSGSIDAVAFQIADQGYVASDPSEVLYYEVLEDTDVAIWTVDLYGMRILAEKPESSIRMQFGLRIGDFDNDYRAVVGIQDVAGTRLDASSNYDQMMGPLVGLAGEAQRGRNTIEGYLGQSVVFSSVELTSMSRDFTGPFGEAPAFYAQETFHKVEDVAIPITEVRLKWTFRISKHLALGLGANTSVWWDMPVPPGVVPIPGGGEALHESTIVLFGLAGAVELTF